MLNTILLYSSVAPLAPRTNNIINTFFFIIKDLSPLFYLERLAYLCVFFKNPISVRRS